MRQSYHAAPAVQGDELRAHEPDPGRTLLARMSIRIWADELRTAAAPPTLFAPRSSALAALPSRPAITAALFELRAMGQAWTPQACLRLIEETVRTGAGGALTPEQLHNVVFPR